MDLTADDEIRNEYSVEDAAKFAEDISCLASILAEVVAKDAKLDDNAVNKATSWQKQLSWMMIKKW